jgi:hypothetical protein
MGKSKILLVTLLAILVLFNSTNCNLADHETIEDQYHRLTYDQVLYKLKRAALLYPESVQLNSAHSFPTNPSLVDSELDSINYLNLSRCQTDKICEHPVLKITDFRSPIEDIN